ncbi:MAG TPA: cyanophycinase [Candidatus Acidoferrales bacterium]
MTRRIGRLAVAIVGVGMLAWSAAAQDVGPKSGSLVVVGGAMRNEAIVKRFIDLAGGPGAPIVLIPTAGGAESYHQDSAGARQFRAAGAANVTVLHTYSRAVADTEEFAAPLRTARGVFFGGGRHWRLADAYLNTRTHRELRALLDRGGVIGGTSAGATILGSFMVRGDTSGNTIMVGDHVEGLGFLRNVTVDQHVLRRNRQFDLIPVIEQHPHLLGIGIDEDTAIVVRGDEFEVIGSSYVLIYDNRRSIQPGGRFYFLAPGDRYNLKTRQGVRPAGNQARPIDRVTDQPWPH